MTYGRGKKKLTPDDEIRILHEAYQFLLKKFKLGESPRGSTSDTPLVSPFMKLDVEPPPKPIDLDDENADNNDKNEEDDDDDVFGGKTIEGLEQMMDIDSMPPPMTVPQIEKTESDDEEFTKKNALTLPTKKKISGRQRSRSFRAGMKR